MTTLYSECPACGWQPDTDDLNDDEDPAGEKGIHHAVARHIENTDDPAHNDAEDDLPESPFKID